MKVFKKNWLWLFLIFDVFLAILAFQLYSPSDAQGDDKPPLHKVADKEIKAVTAKPSQDSPDKKKTKVKKQKVLIDAPQVMQNPELARGCEVTSLDMMLQDAGVDVDKMTLANKIKKVPFKKNGVRGNPNDGFVGNMATFSESGLGVYHGPLADLAEKYLPNRIIDMTGQSFDSVIDQLKKGIPVVVITNYTFKPIPESHFRTWHTASGDVKVTYDQHAVLITGFDDDSIYFNNPLGGKNVKTDRNEFVEAWKQLGKQAISYRK
ncbi:uncharacterized protein YvpB [Scopulibacillus darangshiensis]|uniref:Uncharacterized protein YvpB n=1 Tax=Scopulibacillus darangshiensis TaxID=442528 RepID=A0A4R2NX77_9BACL|nr:C39 family peptidase [Scopulibacillus darangshiensis]TCP26025.1 uncharacterized protein YvpB [Scopulibacillus darangshiensis]